MRYGERDGRRAGRRRPSRNNASGEEGRLNLGQDLWRAALALDGVFRETTGGFQRKDDEGIVDARLEG